MMYGKASLAALELPLFRMACETMFVEKGDIE